MTTDHPMKPSTCLPDELFKKARSLSCLSSDIDRMVVEWAYAAGADAELKAVQDWCLSEGYPKLSRNIHAARRPKPLSLKEQAQRIMAENGTTIDGRLELDVDDRQIIEAALLRLPD